MKKTLQNLLITSGAFLLLHMNVMAQSPGGVATNLKLWAKANSLGLTDGTAVTTWTNSSGGTSPTQATVAKKPTFKNNTTDNINSNPVVAFNGTSNELVAASGFSGSTTTFTQAHVFTVFKSANATQTSDLIYEPQNSSGTVDISVPWSGTTYWDAGSCCTASTVTSTFQISYSNVPMLWSFSKDGAGTASGFKQDIRMNGAVQASKTSTASFKGNSSNFYLGSENNSYFYNGQIAEIIYYLGATINAAAQNKIESYLAVKYGLTLDQSTAQSYTASNGTIIWNGNTNAGYKNNIFGIGRDSVSGLNQTTSASVNSNVLSMTYGSAFINNSFIMLGDNGSANVLSSVTGYPSNIIYKTNTVWKATQTGTRISANYLYNTAGISGYFAPIASSMIPYMLVDSNADGTYETVLTSTASTGTSYTFNANIKSGALISFGYKPQLDYGDAPNVPTTSAAGGAAHLVVSGVYLGTLIDAEADGMPSVNCVGDDTTGLADEDGVDFNIGVATNGQNILQIGMANSVKVTASTTGYIDAWVDLNQDGTYGGGGEYAIQKVAVVAGINTISFNLSDSISYGGTSMRFRFAKATGDVTGPNGLAINGEVEDYKIYITAPLVGSCTNGFQNSSFELGPAPLGYTITDQTNLPYWGTTAADKQVEVWQTGFNGVPAYDGNYFMELNANMAGALYQDVYTTPGTTLLWHFAHRGRGGVDSCNLKIGVPGATIQKAVVGDGVNAWGVYTGSYIVPANQYITRFEFNALYAVGGISVGNFLDDVYVSNSFDYGDAPNTYGTLKSNSGPYHAMTGDLYLGTTVTCDADGQPNTAATGDGGDDGITFSTVCASCNTYSVTASVFNNSGNSATLAGWIDFNKNGIFDAGERISTTVSSSATQQTLTLTWTLTSGMISNASNNKIYARFRISNTASEVASPTGLATSGEVEDYLLACGTITTPIPTNSGPVCAKGPLSLFSTGSAPFYIWSGPNSYSSNNKNATKSPTALADSGSYRVYAIYANGCEADSATKVVVNNCYVSLSGMMFNDRNGDGAQGTRDTSTNFGNAFYAIVTDTFNAVLASNSIAPNGTFAFTNTIPAYTTGMTLTVSNTNPSAGSIFIGPLWPTARWSATKNTYGTNNQAGTGLIASQVVPISTANSNITGVIFGVDRLPTTATQSYTIAKPLHNAKLALVSASGLNILSGTDPEDGLLGANASFKITSVTAMNGNQLYYDVNGNTTLEVAELLAANSIIVSYVPARLYMKFMGLGSTSATFSVAAIDSAGKADALPQTYTVRWTGGSLPVKMLYFGAEKQDDTKALLKWATAQEIDNDRFEIERSADGEDWSNIGEVKGAGNSSTEQQYSIVDENPLNGVNYYRLKQVDVDGHFEYSTIAQVTFDLVASNTTLIVYPNPSNKENGLNVVISNQNDLITNVTISNTIGQTIFSRDLPEWESYHVNGLELDKGIYMVNVTTRTNKHLVCKVIIQ